MTYLVIALVVLYLFVGVLAVSLCQISSTLDRLRGKADDLRVREDELDALIRDLYSKVRVLDSSLQVERNRPRALELIARAQKHFPGKYSAARYLSSGEILGQLGAMSLDQFEADLDCQIARMHEANCSVAPTASTKQVPARRRTKRK